MRISRKRMQASLAIAAQAALCSTAAATVTYTTAGSTVTLTQVEDRNPAEVIHNPAGGLPIAVPANFPGSFQLSNNFNSDGNLASTSASGSVSEVTNALQTSFNLAPGTGITQTNTAGYYNGQSQLQINFNMKWTVGAGGFVDPTAAIMFNVAGNLAVGDSVVVVSDPGNPLTFQAINPSNVTLGTVAIPNSPALYTNSTPGAFTGLVAINQLIDGLITLPQNSTITLKGQLDFRAKDPGGTASMGFLQAEGGSAPATDISLISNSGNWSDAASWQSDGLAPNIPGAVQQGFPVRAAFFATSNNPPDVREINLDLPVILSDLEFDDTAGISIGEGFNASSTPQFTFDPNFPAVIHVGNINGAAGNEIDPTITANGPSLDLQVASGSGLRVDGQVTASATTPVTKLGDGVVKLNATNSIPNFDAKEGETDANAPGSLGTTSTTVEGDLQYNAVGASVAPVNVEANGEVDLGVVPTSSDHFVVHSLGTIDGSSDDLAGLNSSNLTLQPGAMVGHSAPGGSDPVNVASSPQLEYGISADFNDGGTTYTQTVGGGSSGPWKGFGGDQGHETYGSDPGKATDVLTILGNADLISLDGGGLSLNAQLAGAGAITKDGLGDFELDHTGTVAFIGPINIANGTLTVNDTLPPQDSVTVGTSSLLLSTSSPPPAPPTLDGTGTIQGPVVLESGGAIEPGTPSTPGTLTLDSLTMTSGSFMKFRLGAPGDADRLIVNGDVTLGGTLDLLTQPDFQPGMYTFFDYTGTLSGRFNNIEVPDGYRVTTSFSSGEFSADVELVPEPVALPLLGTAALLLRRRRRILLTT